jgi:hypothetical protein
MKDITNKVFSTFEPKVKNRFIITFPETLGLPSYIAKSITNIVYNAELEKWDLVTISLYNPISPSTEQSIFLNIIAPKLKVIDKITITQLGPIGDKVGEFVLVNSIVDIIDFDNYAWSNTEITNTNISLRPENIIINY